MGATMKNSFIILFVLTFYLAITDSHAVGENACGSTTWCSRTSKCPSGTTCAIPLNAPANLQIGCCQAPPPPKREENKKPPVPTNPEPTTPAPNTPNSHITYF